MSAEKLRQEAARWLSQAIDDWEAAEALTKATKYAQACFYAQQAVEKAMKAVWFALDLDPWGQSAGKLITQLPESVRVDFLDYLDTALGLDKFYISTRYPDALADLTPAEAYTQKEAEQAVRLAHECLSHIQHWLATHPE